MDGIEENDRKALKKAMKRKRQLELQQQSVPEVVETSESHLDIGTEDDTVRESGAEDDTEKAARKAAKKAAKKKRKLDALHREKSTGNSDSINTTNDSASQTKASKKKSKAIIMGDYVEHCETTAMTSENVDAYREECAIRVFPDEDSKRFHPITSFEHLYPSLGTFCPQVLSYIQEKNFSKPSPVQSQCWPPLLAGRDCIGIAATGSGKTLAFLIPALLRLAKSPAASRPGAGTAPRPRPRMLILAPTRELAMQSQQVVSAVGACGSACIYGGMPKGPQKAALRGAEVVVATPGRLQDLMDEGAVDLSAISYLVLDEADRMLDDGFEPAIRKILGSCPSAENGRQTAMFSATWPDEIRALAETFLKSDLIRVTVGSEDLSANYRVKQVVECIDANAKPRRLYELLATYHKSRTNRCLIFVLYKKEAVHLLSLIQAKGFSVTAIHGDMGQADRTNSLEEFKSGRVPLLIATDVAARGLDIPNVEYVINYSFPLTVEDYVHRIGRTGRGGASGISHTFFTDFDKGLAGALVAVLQDANQEVPQEIFKYPMVTKKKTSKLYGDFGPKQELVGKKATKITFDDDA